MDQQMRLDEIRQVVAGLDKDIPKENARVSIQKYGADLNEAFIVATTNGYLRLGVEFLKAGLAPYLPAEKSLGQRHFAIDVELDYLMAEDSDVQFDYFERRDDMKIETAEESRMDRIIPFIIIGVMLSVLALALVGLVSIIKALF